MGFGVSLVHQRSVSESTSYKSTSKLKRFIPCIGDEYTRIVDRTTII